MLNKTFKETDIYKLFNVKHFNQTITAFNGQEIKIENFGSINKSDGPDFRDAFIIIDGIHYNGDIEIDYEISDWKKHGHFLNPKYNKVILHICINNPKKIPTVTTHSKRKVPSITLEQLFQQKYFNEILTNIDNLISKDTPYIYCGKINNAIKQDIKYKYIVKKGAERYQNKVKKIYTRVKELAYINLNYANEPVVKYNFDKDFYLRTFSSSEFNKDEIWQQVLFEFVMEALGYSQNKLMMKNLALNLPINFIKQNFDFTDRGKFIKQAEAYLHFIAGFYKSTSDKKEFVKDDYYNELFKLHHKIRLNFDFKTYRRDNWNFGKQRPQNSPFVRIAGAARFLATLLIDNLFAKIIKKFSEIHHDDVLANSIKNLFIVKADGYWKYHTDYGIETKEPIEYFIGSMRADDIMVNVIFPILNLYFEIFNQPELAKRAFNIFTTYQAKSDISVISNMAKSLNLTETNLAIIQQGLLELYKNYCLNTLCYECEIGKIVFDLTDIEL
ncbi:MAG TPA: DUF2851 family protein [Ignavibacteriales bacterium]|nr:DUF2851 family protein [Ignavibacteriales bacterium]HOL81884.1 DUF2851 family protein [Ignavibacteriales bacterium]HOM65015.1 DUF2851 family protein [Ignavibacteriales bacterium]HPD67253.1 DUF2851 family protein [Ignavibacteriales bacterium]HPP33979.1 DUF2851 family protein [Ignavibacteriales bacterium]